MPAPIDFYLDFSSPYGYLASQRLGGLAAAYGCRVRWRPMMLGAAFGATGGKPLVDLPLEGDCARHDPARTARFWGTPFALPKLFPVVTLAAARAFYWLEAAAPERAVPFAEAALAGLFAADRKIADRAVVGELLAAVGADPEAGLAAIGRPGIKDKLRAEAEAAISRGVFGSPFVFIDGEPFWGTDRLDQVERWLETGGF